MLGFAAVPLFEASAEGAGRERLPRSAPEAQGIPSSALLDFLDAVAGSRHELHSLMVVRHGHVVAEGWWKPYAAERKHMLYSLSKSFTSTAVGLAVSDGKLSIDDPVISFFEADLPADISPNLRALRVKHLLMMAAGQPDDSMPHLRNEQNWPRAFLARPITYEPGTHFLYNSGATYMLSAIVQHATGQRVLDFLRPRLFEPLGITGMTWETCPRGINTGGWGLSVPTEALAKFGQLYLQRGQWHDRQLIPASWIEQATTFKIQQPPSAGHSLEELKQTSDWHQGYCYQFWRCRHDAFRGDGAYGQFMIVMPEQDAVVAITAETADMQSELNLVWDHILPGMRSNPLPADRATHSQLQKRLAALVLNPPRGISAPDARRYSGQVYQLEPNQLGLTTVEFQFAGRRSTFTATTQFRFHTLPAGRNRMGRADPSARYPIVCGHETWVEGVTSLPGTPPRLTSGDLRPVKVAASGTWTSPATFVMTWRFYETPHHDTVTARFDGNTVELEILDSIAAMAAHPRPSVVLKGKTAA